MKTHAWWFMVSVLLALSCSLYSQQAKHGQVLFGGGGGMSKSSQFVMNSSVGQPYSGESASPQFKQGVGFLGNGGGGQPPIPTFSYTNGWNMVSVPFLAPHYARSFIFPTSTSYAFSYNGGYQQADTLKHGVGYWLKFSGSQLIALQGAPRNTDTLELAEGWNMIGGISSPVDTANVIEVQSNLIASNFYGFDEGYFPAMTLEPGKAYWVKAGMAGSIVLNAGQPSLRAMQAEGSERTRIEEQNINSIIFEQVETKFSKRSKQVLFLGHPKDGVLELSTYDMPPPPPDGAFDVRFGSNRYMELMPEEFKEAVEIPIRIQANSLELNVTLNLKSEDNLKYSFVERLGKKVVAKHKLETDRSLSLKYDDGRKYSLSIEAVPKEFKLYQNFPNPFNPSTTIRFDLPVAASVTLQVYNVLGQQVALPVDAGEFDEGQHAIEFDASSLATGMYFYRLTALNHLQGKLFSRTNTMMFVK